MEEKLENMNTIEQMKLFMEPRSIVIIGVPRSSGEGLFNTLENLINHGFSGRLYSVNPHADEILGLKSYPSVKDIPEAVDLAVINTPRDFVRDIVRECAERGIKAIQVVAQGFADLDKKGHAAQAELVKIAQERGARIVGPNSFGLVNAFMNLNTCFVWCEMDRSPVGIISQSGTFSQTLSD